MVITPPPWLTSRLFQGIYEILASGWTSSSQFTENKERPLVHWSVDRRFLQIWVKLEIIKIWKWAYQVSKIRQGQREGIEKPPRFSLSLPSLKPWFGLSPWKGTKIGVWSQSKIAKPIIPNKIQNFIWNQLCCLRATVELNFAVPFSSNINLINQENNEDYVSITSSTLSEFT